jgi:hypothetical protein
MRAVLVLAVGTIACSSPFGEDETVRTQTVETMGALPSCGAGWGVAPESFAGVDGSFERLGPARPGEMTTLALSNVVNAGVGLVGEGNATRTFACGGPFCGVETTRASLLPVGTATTPMILFSANGFANAPPDLRGLYDVLGLERDDRGEITTLCLQRVDDSDEAPFLMARGASH